jgi:hypothetical protein
MVVTKGVLFLTAFWTSPRDFSTHWRVASRHTFNANGDRPQ